MKISDYIKGDCVLTGRKIKNKEEAIDALVKALVARGAASDAERLRADILAREQSGSTAIGMGICTPHAKSDAVREPAIAAMTVPAGVDCNAADGAPVKLFFMLAAPASGADAHLEMLSRLMVLLMNADVRDRLIAAKSKKEFLAVIDRAENEKYGGEQVSTQEPEQAPAERRYIVAVTACPTGIAHTFMAAEALAQAGQAAGVEIKVETCGSSGVQNAITADDLARADAVIVAADKKVDTDRFDGMRVITCPVSDGIRRPDALIAAALAPDAPIFHAHTDSKSPHPTPSGGARGVYRHLMNGVSHMLPFVVGGGILIAIAFLIDGFATDAQTAGNAFGTVHPIAAFFKNTGGMVFDFMLPVLAGYIAMSIADRPGLVVGFAGAAMATSGYAFSMNGGLSFAQTSTSGGFLGALLAGFLAGYLMLALKAFLSFLPNSLDGIRTVLLYPVLGCALILLVMALLNPFVGMASDALYAGLNSLSKSGNIVLLGAVLGGMMAIDMGGPFNKAAYTFATVGLASNTDVSFLIMAAVMAGGMIPPLAIALSTTFFPRRWTGEERKGGAANYLMGLSFISEGAIPYASADPLRVIPSCVIGSAVAGGLSMFFSCTLRAPHGGIFVLPTIGNFGMYAVAVAAGAAIGALVLTALKARPHNYDGAIAPSDFSSDNTKSRKQ